MVRKSVAIVMFLALFCLVNKKNLKRIDELQLQLDLELTQIRKQISFFY